MSKRRWLDRSIAGMLIVLGVYLYREALDFPMGADLFPKFMLITIIGLAALMLINSFRIPKQPETPPAEAPGIRDIFRPYMLFLCIVAYIIMILLTGFFPSTIGMGIVLMPVLEVTRKKFYLGILTGATLFIFVLFVHFLNVPLPKGILFE